MKFDMSEEEFQKNFSAMKEVSIAICQLLDRFESTGVPRPIVVMAAAISAISVGVDSTAFALAKILVMELEKRGDGAD